MKNADELIRLIEEKKPLAALLAPSFPIVYDLSIIGKLKRIGFSKVVEISAGANETNKAIIEILNKNPKAKIITGPCATLVPLIKTKYPRLIKYLAQKADSPMIATAKIVREKFPGLKPVFIGPCIAKKLEASLDHPDLEILVVTYKELDDVFKYFGIINNPKDENNSFDIKYKQTRLYPISGGLTQSSGVREILSDDQIQVVSGWQKCQKALEEFEKNDVRLLDILFCDGGCINGPGIVSNLTLGERRQKVVDYWLKG